MLLRLLPDLTVVDTAEKAASVLEYLMKRGGPLAIDTETTGLDMFRARVVCWSMATEDRRYFVTSELLLFFDPLFRRKDVLWYMANAKFDLHMLANMGVQIRGPVWDIVVMDAMDDDTRPHGLKEQSRLAYGIRWGDFSDLFLDPKRAQEVLKYDAAAVARFRRYSIGEKLQAFADERPDILENYASCDAFFTYKRADDLARILQAQPLPTEMCPGFNTLFDYYKVIEVPFTRVLWKMERTGIPVDLDYVKRVDAPMRDGIRGKVQELREIGGVAFNPLSTVDLIDTLFSTRGYRLAPASYTKGGQPGTSEKDLQLLLTRAKDDRARALIKGVLELRHLSKLHGTYVAKVEKILGPDGRIHCRYNQTGARTGRLSASDPNLQNIPTRNDEFGLRKMFVAAPGRKLVVCDYPQIQPRLAAVFADETKLLEAIRAGFDIHSANAANMYGRHNKDVTYEAIEAAKKAKEAKERELTPLEKALLKKRDGAKTVGLGVLFGEGPAKMAAQLGITLEESKELRETFFDTYPGIRKSIDDTISQAYDRGFCNTMLGRIRRLHMIANTINRGKAAAEERQAYNTLIQGSEVEVMKLAMLQLDDAKEFRGLDGEMHLTVHDELATSAPEKDAKDMLALMKDKMGDPLRWGPIQLTLPVPVSPDGGIGRTWAEAK